jgi:hypothetical protein
MVTSPVTAPAPARHTATTTHDRPTRLGRGALRPSGPFANGGDNIGIYVPVFTQSSPGGFATYVVVFLVLVAVW